MNQKTAQMILPRLGFYFLIMVVFALITAGLGHVDVAVAELIITAMAFGTYYAASVRRKKEVERFLKNLVNDLDESNRESLLHCPLPVVIFQPDSDEVIWSNDRFVRLCPGHEGLFHSRMADLAPNFNSRWLLEGKTECPSEVLLNDRRYQVFGSISGTMATTYWLDVTDFANTRDIYKATRPVVGILLLDNYEDTIKSQEDSVRTAMLAEINQKFTQWVGDTGGVFCQLDRDRFLFLFEEQYLADYKAEKFSVLDSVRTVTSPNGIPVTLSIGIGIDGDSPVELFRFANLSVDMALSRGGDQAVIKDRNNFEFYGGRTKETEKRTKVKSRVMASALSELMADASSVLVMGHRAADMDAVGAAVGVCAIARKQGTPAYIVRESNPTPAEELYRKINDTDDYIGHVIDTQDALLRVDANTLLVVVDTNRPEQVASPDVLAACKKVAVIDHHRRAASYIEAAALNFHEPSASSASELVSELLGYIMEPGELRRGEAEALMAGLMLDTKNFTMRTGGRTFEAAAFLRRAGGDTGEVKKLFQTNLDDAIAKYSIIQNATSYRSDIAIATSQREVGRVTAAQAADELLNISGIETSFVLYQSGEQVIISARSLNETNVQVILEALGGGGNAAAAGAQVPDSTVEQVLEQLIETLDSYFAEDEDEAAESEA